MVNLVDTQWYFMTWLYICPIINEVEHFLMFIGHLNFPFGKVPYQIICPVFGEEIPYLL